MLKCMKRKFTKLLGSKLTLCVFGFKCCLVILQCIFRNEIHVCAWKIQACYFGHNETFQIFINENFNFILSILCSSFMYIVHAFIIIFPLEKSLSTVK